MKVQRMFIATVAALSLAGLVVSTGYAQQPQGGAGQGNGQGAGRRRVGGQQGQQQRRMPMVEAIKALNLPVEQQTKVDALIEKSRTDTRALPQEERRTKGREIQRKLQSDINALLTPEQKTKLREELRKLRQNGGNNAGPFNGMIQPLNLTAEQKTKIDPIIKDATDQMAKLRTDQNLQGRERGQKTRAIVQETRSKIRPLLTPDQQTKFDSYRPGQGGGNRQGGANRQGGGARRSGGTGVGG